MSSNLQQLVKTHLNLDLSEVMVAQFQRYTSELIAWNERFNLTSITDPAEIQIKHFLDSLSVLTLADLPDQARMIDVGSGAGLPGLALKIVRPSWHMTLLEATGKKVDFLKYMITALDLKNTTAVKMRAEEAGQESHHREKYDLVVARAVARLPVLLEYLLPLCKIGGRCIAMRGESAHEEIAGVEYAIQALGGKLDQIERAPLPEMQHFLICIRKANKTPPEYPRRPGIPAKKPLSPTG